ncbi:MAG: glycosyltransferase family 2 protein [Planctomycetes bacterium]|nr:glycosyltransferase family 2 protein [Planctomycetota bacterium]
MSLSVVICTYKRPGEVANLLASLRDQSYPVMKAIVVDASPDTRSRESIDGIRDALGYPVLYVRAAYPSLPNQRREGIARATGEYVGFLDDDVVLAPDFFEKLIKVLEEDVAGEVGGVFGYFEGSHSLPTPRWILRKWLALCRPLEPGRYLANGVSVPLHLQPPFEGARPVDYMSGGLTVYRRRVLVEIPIAEGACQVSRLGPWSAEDLHHSLRVGKRYRLHWVGHARARDLHAGGGRPPAFRQGFCAIYGQYFTLRTTRDERRFLHALAFWQYWIVDTVLAFGAILTHPREASPKFANALGRLAAGLCCLVLPPDESRPLRVPRSLDRRVGLAPSRAGARVRDPESPSATGGRQARRQ